MPGSQVTKLPTTHYLNGAVVTAVPEEKKLDVVPTFLARSKRTSESAYGEWL